jgi:hypothetical protein
MRPAHLAEILEQEFLGLARQQHAPVMLWGPPGVGKSQIVAQVAQRFGVPLIDLRLSQMEASDLRGLPFRQGDEVLWAQPAMLPHEARHGAAGILFLDEITSAPPSVSAAAYQLILDRALGDYRLPPGWAIVAAGNRQGDRGVTYAMPAPLANRFTHYAVETHMEDWVGWAQAQGIDERLVAFLRFRPELLFEFDPARPGMAFPTPRTWEYAHRALQKFAQHPHLQLSALSACVGEAAGLECSAFLEHFERLPDLDAILRGEAIEAPAEIDLQYAVVAALVTRCRQQLGQPGAESAWGHVLDWAQQLPLRELGVMLVSDLYRSLGRRLIGLPAFRLWARSVSELMFYE